MMKQWRDLKALAGDSLLFFRLGDFYELFEDDAVTAAPIMGVTLTSRGTKNSSGEKLPLCGVPAAHFELYLHKLLNQGWSVALAEQLAEQAEEPKPGKNLVRREIVQWFTPGIRLLENETEPHYCAVIAGTPEHWAFAAADISTGHSVLESGSSLEALQGLMDQWNIEDLRLPFSQLNEWSIRTAFWKAYRPPALSETRDLILQALPLASWEDQPAKTALEESALASLIRVLADAHPKRKIQLLLPKTSAAYVFLNASTRRHLHLYEPKDKSLFSFLDECQTAAGRRLLKERLAQPLTDLEKIQERQQQVRLFRDSPWMRKAFRERLKNVLDVERLLRKRSAPTHLFSLQQTLESGILALEAHSSHESVSPAIRELHELLTKSIQWSDDSEEGWIKPGHSLELDTLRALKQDSHQHLKGLEDQLKAEWNIPSLKLRMHQVFGLVIEVTATHQTKIPKTAKIIQNLANATRAKTPEVEELEKQVLAAESRAKQLEHALIDQLFQKVRDQHSELSAWAEALAILDWAQAMAEVSQKYSWSTPIAQREERCLSFEAGVHPLIDGDFVPLDLRLNEKDHQLLLLTGPNMAGKSTVMRLAGLIALLHQTGSDVPAKRAQLSVFDRIGCRMGAGDSLTEGKSTFFMEMKEVSSLLHGATEKSLLLFDEIGRGTSTYDGMSLAWAITEALHDLKALGMVATHYLELAELENHCARLKNYHLGVKALDGKLVFTRQLVAGAASQSYGLHVAKLAEISDQILARAQAKLNEFEVKKKTKKASLPLFDWSSRDRRPSL